jgi:7-cyano-7-deazaguanine synthase
MRKVVIGLSGGMDSATLLGYYIQQGTEVHCCSFYYGSKHGGFELEAAKKIIKFYKQWDEPVFHWLFDLSDIFKDFHSSLLLSGPEIPEGNYNDETMKQTVVPGRNLIFASIMAGLAESIGADRIALGVHAGDHYIYADCRPTFIASLSDTIDRSTGGKVIVLAPFLHENKASILLHGNNFEIPVPYSLTRTCYKNQLKACGKCGSCQERLEAFKIIGQTDPIEYV